MTDNIRTARARHAANVLHGRQPHDPRFQKSKAELKTLVLAKHIQEVVNEAPPLTATQRDRLILILQECEVRGA